MKFLINFNQNCAYYNLFDNQLSAKNFLTAFFQEHKSKSLPWLSTQ